MNKLASASVTQMELENGKSNWKVRDAKGNEIAELPAKLNDLEIMEVLRFGRKFELEAFNYGISYQKRLQPKEQEFLKTMVKTLTHEKEQLIKENEKLAILLDKEQNKE